MYQAYVYYTSYMHNQVLARIHLSWIYFGFDLLCHVLNWLIWLSLFAFILILSRLFVCLFHYCVFRFIFDLG